MKPFSDTALSKPLLDTVKELGFETMTPIQEQAIPALLSGRDVIGQSQTGSGKTAAFTLPVLQKIDLSRREIQALVICPTRELSEQVAREIRKLARKQTGLQVLLTVGGLPPKPQGEALLKGVHLVVGTPGRIVDHINRGRMDLRHLKFLILDEADTMLDMGFEEDMRLILDEAPGTRQSALFSATYPEDIGRLAKDCLHDPVRVTIESPEIEKPAVRQTTVNTHEAGKSNELVKILRRFQPQSALIFCNHKATVDELSSGLTALGLSCAGLHGDYEQRDRDRVMAQFRNGSVRLLIATDVAARGLDIGGLDLVVNYDLPFQPEVYVHRIGRTGRAGSTGAAVSLVTPDEEARLAEFAHYPGIKIETGGGAAGVENVSRGKAIHHEAEMRTVVISGGRKDKLRPGDILGALTGDAGIPGSAIGKIEIHDTFSYVAIARDSAETAVERLKAGKIKGKRFSVKFAG